MKSVNISFLLRLKRLIRRLFNDHAFEVTYLIRDECPIEIESKTNGIYSEGHFAETYDPRSQLNIGHYFNTRFEYELHNVILEPVQGLIYSSKGKLLAESTAWPFFQLYSSFPLKPKFRNLITIEDKSILLSSNSYGHWLTEDLGAFLHLAEKFPDALIVTSSKAPKYVRDLLKQLNRKVRYLEGLTHMSNLYFIGKGQDIGWMNKVDLEKITESKYLRDFHSQDEPTKLIYASRRYVKRSPSNEQEFERVLEGLGFEIHILEKMDYLEEISLVSKARFFVSVHGSSHLNSIFMKEGTQVLDIVNDNYWTELGHRINHLRHQKYHFATYAGNENDPIDVSKLEEFIRPILPT